MKTPTASARLKSVLTRAAASASKLVSSSSKSFLKRVVGRKNAEASAETGVDMSSKPLFLCSSSKFAVMPITDAVRVHPVDPSLICQFHLTGDLHTMDPLDRIREALNEEMAERKMCGTISAASCKLVFLGGPGIGKGYRANLLSKWLSIPHISTADLVRKELSKPLSSSATTRELLLQEAVKTAMNQGKLVADNIIVELLWNRLQQMDPSVSFILGSLPRAFGQASILDNAVDGVDRAVSFHLIDEALVTKCLGRRVCSECGKDYSMAHVNIDTHECNDKGVFLPARLPPQECASCHKRIILPAGLLPQQRGKWG